jgi:L-2-hydroxyglutarate oxidase LhgO
MSGERPTLRIVPFRGEYYLLRPERRHLVRNLIYPVPDPRFPFLGVHFTRRIDGSIDAGPNAILALKREGYSKLDISLRETFSELTFSGFWRMVGRYWRTGMAEAYRSLNKQAFVRDLQRLVPEIQSADLVPGGSGVRAQAVKSDGSLLDDFYFAPSPGALHVCNVPSPAATASIPVGREIVRTAAQHLGLAYS